MEDDYEGMDRFDMENDFEGGRWIGGEFYYNRKKDRPVQTKDDAILGVFAAGSSDSDSDGGGRRRKRRRGDVISKSDLTKPVQFVSTGVVMPNEEVDRNLDDNAEPDNPNPPNPSQGLGFGLGFSDEKEKEEEEEFFLPTVFGRKIKEGAEQRKKDREKEKEKERSSSSKKQFGRRDVAGGSDVGKFESHTKGIGFKLMKMMGYKEGAGLGKNEQGIVAPIEAKLRPKNMGMGFNDYKEAKLPVLEEATQEKAAAVPLPSGRLKEKLWSKQKQGRKKSEILTKDELLARKQEQGVEVVQKVLDMRGPQVKVLTSLEHLNVEDAMKDNEVPMPELQYNVRLIVDTTEVDIQKLDRDLRREREKVASLSKEKAKIMMEETRQRKQLLVMETIAGVLEQVEEDNSSGALTLESLLGTFGDLKEKFGEDYKLCNLSCIACAFAYPLFIRVFQGWEPLQNPLHGLKLMSLWRDLLQSDQPFDYSDGVAVSPYAQLVSEVVLPAVRISGTNTWQARDPEPMLRFLESWDRLLPPVVLQSILENVVMPKLSTAVDSWDPRRETVPIHVWVHPWLPLLGQRLETLYHTICYKLGSVLHVWHASDASAYAILSPWKDVFDAASWEGLIVRHIVPKLKMALQEFQVNPANQKLDQFNWVMMWASAIPIHHMVQMLEVDFFSKWQQVLYHWLCSNPNFNEVMQWYMGWKGLFPPELLANERIRLLLSAGLDMMNQAVEGMEVVQPGARENVSYLRATEKRQFEAQQQAAQYSSYQQPSSVSGTGIPEMSFKESIQAFAMEQGLLFMPRVGKFYNGLPIYEFGSVSICIDSVKRLLYAQVQEGIERWNAVSLTQLMEMNRTTRPC
ncbi:septin and tuftelin-interacting protein 1 homolog 1 [Typha latifolia]|uniref:septin and tuftelin-interacting protein 1 homolog 1 n=1 Tax=Typha latifolia TaxID=4733 RepID=UPI003C2D0C2F